MKNNYKILKNGLYQISKKHLKGSSKQELENNFKKLTNKNDINIIELVKTSKLYYYFNVTQLF